MATAQSHANIPGSARTSFGMGGTRTIPVTVLGLSLSVFFAFSYVVCILGYLLLPGMPVDHAALEIFLPGFTLLTWKSYFLGLAESFAWGWYVALVFGPLYNFFIRRVS
jgi:hypothetical protein